MRFPAECYQMLETIDTHFSSCLRPAQRRCLVHWVYGTMVAKSALQNAVIAALTFTFLQLERRRGTQPLPAWPTPGSSLANPAACHQRASRTDWSVTS